MPRNASGVYSLPLPPVVPNTLIEADYENTTSDDIATALTDSLDRFGRGGMAGPFRLVDGTQTAPGLAWAAETNSGLWRESTGVVNFSVLTTKVGTWTAAGYSGILAGPLTGDPTVTGSWAWTGGDPLKFKKSNDSYIGWYDDAFTTVKSYIQAVGPVLKVAGETGVELNIGGSGVAARLTGTSWAPTVDVSAYLGEGNRRWSNLFVKEMTPSETITFNEVTGLIRKANSTGNVVVTGESALVNDSARTAWYGSAAASRALCIDHSANTHLFTGANYNFTLASLDYALTENGCVGLRVGGGNDEFSVVNRGYISVNGNDSVFGLRVSGVTVGYLYAQPGQMSLLALGARPLIIGSNGLEALRITDTNFLRVGDPTMTGDGHVIAVTAGAGGVILNVATLTNGSTHFYGGNSSAYNSAGASQKVWSLDGRSINAAGTLNASGADYAEYEDNGGLDIAKGDLVGFTAAGVLTRTFDDAVRFGIKSTDPSFVGGDTWGSDLEGEALAAAQSRVDRVAYSGKVPVNVFSATPGGYVVAARDPLGYIVGRCVTNIDFAQYTYAVGRVNKMLPDGRAEVAVIVH